MCKGNKVRKYRNQMNGQMSHFSAGSDKGAFASGWGDVISEEFPTLVATKLRLIRWIERYSHISFPRLLQQNTTD